MFIAAEATRVLMDRWLDKQNVNYTHNGILLIFKKEGYSDTSTTWLNFVDIILSETSQSPKGKMLCDATYMW